MSQVKLKSSHLVVAPEVIQAVGNEDRFVFATYDEAQKRLLLSKRENDWFTKLHKTSELMLKDRDIHGTKSISVREILLDNNIDESDRELAFELDTDRGFLKVQF